MPDIVNVEEKIDSMFKASKRKIIDVSTNTR